MRSLAFTVLLLLGCDEDFRNKARERTWRFEAYGSGSAHCSCQRQVEQAVVIPFPLVVRLPAEARPAAEEEASR